MPESAKDRLSDLRRKLNALSEAEKPPPTMLQILGRSHLEDDWQQILVHFLTPDGAHGFDHAVLEHLLTALSERDGLEFSFSRFDLENTHVEQEVVTGQGRPDILIWSPEKWFICFEVKIDAAETNDQTERYVEVDSFGGKVDEDDVPNDGHNYVYLAPEGTPSPSADEFVEISWEWVASELQTFLAESYGEYPSRSMAQLEEFVDTVRSELTMTEYQENQQEMSELYVRHYDDIQEVKGAFDDRWSEFENEWGSRLAEALGSGRAVEASKVTEDYVTYQFENEKRDEKWIFRDGTSDWAWIFKEDWWIDVDTGKYSSNGNDVRVGFLHRLGWNRNNAVRDHELKFYFRKAPPSPDEFKEAFEQMFYDQKDEIDELLPKLNSITGNKGNMIETTYEIDVGSHDTFFDAYTDALKDAFSEHVSDNEELVQIIDEMYSISLEEIGVERDE
jgi:hypothetical protein